jgi:hypothetical protein
MPDPDRPANKRSSLLLGLGFDGEDGEKRITKGRDFLLLGGGADTHAEMTERAIKLDEELSRRGMRLSDIRSSEEMREIVGRAWK